MYKKQFDKLNSKKHRWVNEEEVRQGWVISLNEALGIDLDAERGKRDLSYNNVIIEFKDRGLFKGKISSRSFKEAIFERLLPYIVKTSQKEGIEQSDYIGIAIDGEHICFAQVLNNKIEHGHLLPFSEVSFSMVLTALKDNYRRSLTARNLIEDFGHSSECGLSLMSAFSVALSNNINSSENNKTKMLFEEWKTLFGQVADLSIEQIESINKTLHFTVSTTEQKRIPAALFIIHTYNSFIIKLLAAEIISSHKLTSYLNFSQNLSLETDEELINKLQNEIEKGGFYSKAGIKGFVEEALFSWYLDSDNDKLSKSKIAAIRQILIKLSFYRTDNLTEARSNDLLKLFYQNLVPETLRKTLGEFYTPDWLVSFTLNKIKNINWLNNRSLDPTCGSGSFLLEIIRRKIIAATKANWSDEQILKLVTTTVWGFDLNPLAVQTARVNFLISIADILRKIPGEQIELPVLLADAIYSPARNPRENEDIVTYRIGSEIADLEITIPAELAFNRKRLNILFEIYGEAIEADKSYEKVELVIQKSKLLTTKEINLWQVPLKNTYDKVLRLHRNNWNGIWFRIIRNFFWSATAGEFDLIAGNPPWVRWSKLPELYRERVKPTCMQYNIFSNTPHHGGNELDISGMITYTVADKWLSENGIMAFILTQTHFQSPSSQGFRDFKINEEFHINPKSVDDMKELRPFPDAVNKTAVVIFKKEFKKEVRYPVDYVIWKAKDNNVKVIPVGLKDIEVLKRIQPFDMEAYPVTTKNSPWSILPRGRFQDFKRLSGKCNWIQGRKGITADLNGVYFVNIIDTNKKNGLVKICTRPEAGKTNIGPAQEFWIEPHLLFPLIKGASDFTRSYFHKEHNLYALVPNTGIVKKAYEDAEEIMTSLRNTKEYLSAYKKYLEQRSTFKGRMKNAPYYAVYNVGNYTFSPWKVIWAEQKDFCAAVVSTSETPLIGNRPFIPDHKIFFADFEKPEPAYFLSGLLNSEMVIEYIKSHNISIQIGDIFKHMNLPEYNSKISLHKELVTRSKRCHNEIDNIKREAFLEEISEIAIKIINY